MGLDVGDARIGIALSAPLGDYAIPHSIIERRKSKYINEILAIAQSENVRQIVLGLPLKLDGSNREQAAKVTMFMEELKAAIAEAVRQGISQEIEVISWDERLSSVQAERLLQGCGLKNRKLREAIDQLSAAIILEAYLQAQNTNLD